MAADTLKVQHAEPKKARVRFRSLGRKEDLVNTVVRALEKEIVEGRLAVGERLPPERDFAERLGVSRTVLREAVRILVTKGLLETRHGVGTTVRQVTHTELVKPLTLFLRTCDREVSIDQLHQVRSFLEVENAGLAAQQATEEDIDDLRRLCNEMEAAAREPEQFSVKDAEFHRRLGQTTRNPLITLLLDSIRGLMAEVRTMVANQPGLYEQVMPGHWKVMKCVAAGNVKGARRAMREHLDVALSIQRGLIAEKS